MCLGCRLQLSSMVGFPLSLPIMLKLISKLDMTSPFDIFFWAVIQLLASNCFLISKHLLLTLFVSHCFVSHMLCTPQWLAVAVFRPHSQTTLWLLVLIAIFMDPFRDQPALAFPSCVYVFIFEQIVLGMQTTVYSVLSWIPQSL